MTNQYLDLLANFGIGGAHPGGFNLSKSVLENESIGEAWNVLDIGCGTGQTAAFLAQTFQCHVTAVDKHHTMVDKAKNRMKRLKVPVTVLNGDAQQLPFQDNLFDLIVAESVITFTDIKQTVSELARVVKEEGKVIAIEMTAEHPVSEEWQKQIFELYGVRNILNEYDWKKVYLNSGFSKVDTLISQSELVQTDIPDVQPSHFIEEDLYHLWEKHLLFTNRDDNPLGFRVYRCVK